MSYGSSKVPLSHRNGYIQAEMHRLKRIVFVEDGFHVCLPTGDIQPVNGLLGRTLAKTGGFETVVCLLDGELRIAVILELGDAPLDVLGSVLRGKAEAFAGRVVVVNVTSSSAGPRVEALCSPNLAPHDAAAVALLVGRSYGELPDPTPAGEVRGVVDVGGELWQIAGTFRDDGDDWRVSITFPAQEE